MHAVQHAVIPMCHASSAAGNANDINSLCGAMRSALVRPIRLDRRYTPDVTGCEAFRAWPHILLSSHCAMYTSALRQIGPEIPRTLDAMSPASSMWHTWYIHANRKPIPYSACARKHNNEWQSAHTP